MELHSLASPKPELIFAQVLTTLQESEERMRQLAENVSEVIWLSDKTFTQILYVSPAYEKIWGRSCQSFYEQPMSFAEALYPADREHLLARLDKQLRGDETNSEYRIVRPDGTISWIRDRSFPIRNEAGEFYRIAGVAEDITKRKQAESDLQQQRAELQLIFDTVPALIFYKDRDHRLVRVNRELARVVGLPKSAIEGRTDAELGSQYVDQYHRDEKEVIATGEPKRGLVEPLETVDGIRWLQTDKLPYRDETGQIAGIIGFAVDITERKRAEEERARLTSVLEKSLNEIYIFDAQTLRFDYVNEGTVRNLGYSLATLQQMTPLDLQSEFTETTFREMVDPLLKGETEQHIFYTMHRRADGSGYPAEVHLQLVDQGGKQVFLAVVLDITERKKSEAELEKVHKQLLDTSRQAGMAEVATGVLHNVGNVLNSVNVSSTLVSEMVRKSKAANLSRVAALLREHASDLGKFITSDPKGKQLPDYLGQLAEHLVNEQNVMLRELHGLRKNIEHVKDIVAMQQSYAKVSGLKEIIKVTDLVEDSLRLNAGALDRHGVETVREFEDVPPINVDKHKVLQILVNLVRNAKYACQDSGRTDKRLTVRVAHGDGRVKISVVDNGVGIPTENLTRIFNHGFTTRRDGHGFGLHSGALAAKEMGGSLSMHSDGIGKGAAFTLELPLDDPALAA